MPLSTAVRFFVRRAPHGPTTKDSTRRRRGGPSSASIAPSAGSRQFPDNRIPAACPRTRGSCRTLPASPGTRLPAGPSRQEPQRTYVTVHGAAGDWSIFRPVDAFWRKRRSPKTWTCPPLSRPVNGYQKTTTRHNGRNASWGGFVTCRLCTQIRGRLQTCPTFSDILAGGNKKSPPPHLALVGSALVSRRAHLDTCCLWFRLLRYPSRFREDSRYSVLLLSSSLGPNREVMESKKLGDRSSVRRRNADGQPNQSRGSWQRPRSDSSRWNP